MADDMEPQELTANERRAATSAPVKPTALGYVFVFWFSTGTNSARECPHHYTQAALKKTACGCCGQIQMGWYDRKVRRIQIDAATLGDCVGKYQFDFGALDVVLNSDHLEAKLTGQPPFPIFANARDKFFYTIVDAQLDFERDAGGKVVAVVLHQNGRDMRAPRMTTPQTSR
jgi:serine-type D-Ala-D-Ala carboxypeptidase/endopeptidase